MGEREGGRICHGVAQTIYTLADRAPLHAPAPLVKRVAYRYFARMALQGDVTRGPGAYPSHND